MTKESKSAEKPAKDKKTAAAKADDGPKPAGKGPAAGGGGPVVSGLWLIKSEPDEYSLDTLRNEPNSTGFWDVSAPNRLDVVPSLRASLTARARAGGAEPASAEPAPEDEGAAPLHYELSASLLSEESHLRETDGCPTCSWATSASSTIARARSQVRRWCMLCS